MKMQIDTSKPIIVSSGQKWTDIDAYACAIGLNELLKALDINSKVVLPGVLNESIPEYLKNLNVEYSTKLEGINEDYNYILVDISEADHFPGFVIQDRIIRLYDHRFLGFEDYWKDKLGVNSKIEHVGSCATLIFEEYEEEKLQNVLPKEVAVLIAHAIISNTLNLQAGITSERDRVAIKKIESLKILAPDYKSKYFKETSRSILNDPIPSVKNDTKLITIKGKEFLIGQLEIWDARIFVNKWKDEIIKHFESLDTANYFFTAPSISEGKNYIITRSKYIKDLLGTLVGIKFNGDVGVTDKLYLRKELMAKISESGI